MYVDVTDQENFNHKHSGTLMFCENNNQWIYVDSVSDGVLRAHVIKDACGKVSSYYLDRRQEEPLLLRKGPDVQFYNDVTRGESFYFRRRPRRSMRHTITWENTDIHYPFWKSLPTSLAKELGDEVTWCNSLTRFGWWLNNNTYFSFEEALKKVSSDEMISCAFDKHFMVSLSLTNNNENTYTLWYTHIPIGVINVESKRVSIDKLIMLQEVKDVLRNHKCSWLVVS